MHDLSIDLANLPEGGKRYQGSLAATLWQLEGDKDVAQSRQLDYNLWVERFDDELLLQGDLSSEFVLRCVRCLQEFPYTLQLLKHSISIDLSAQAQALSINVEQMLRDELLLQLPAYPNCSMSKESVACKADDKHFVLDKQDSNSVQGSPDSTGPNVWATLDKLQNLKNNNS